MQNPLLKVVFLAFFFGMSSLYSQSEKGLILGRVIAESGNVLSGVKISVSGSKDTVFTDVEGRFSVSAEAGQRIVTVEADGYDMVTETLLIVSGKETFYNPIVTKAEKIGRVDIVKKKKPTDNSVAAAI
jgi:hypothetical protein